MQAKAATLTIAQGFSLAYQNWQEVQVPVRREKQVETVVVTQAVVEKQPFDAEGPIITAGDLNSIKNDKYLIF